MKTRFAALAGFIVLLGSVYVAFAGPIGEVLADSPSTTTGLGFTLGALVLRWAWWLSSKLTSIEDRMNTLSAQMAKLPCHLCASTQPNEKNDIANGPPAD